MRLRPPSWQRPKQSSRKARSRKIPSPKADWDQQRNPIVPKNIPITLACGDYEITRPLLDGSVAPDGIDLTVLTDMDSTTRHWRFRRKGDFDLPEPSSAPSPAPRAPAPPITPSPVS